MVAAAVIGGAVITAGAGYMASESAAETQSDAARDAARIQQQMYQQTRTDLSPYNLAGQGVLNQLLQMSGQMPALAPELAGRTFLTDDQIAAITALQQAQQQPTAAGGDWGEAAGATMQAQQAQALQQQIEQQFGAEGLAYLRGAPDYLRQRQQFQDYEAMRAAGPGAGMQAQLEQLPGYQFALSQGLKASTNMMTQRGLGLSGAAMRGAAEYATGLADQTFGDQWNRLMGIATLGQNAAAQTGAFGTQTASNVGNALIGGANARAAASIAQGQAIGNIGNTVGNLYMTNALLQNQGYTGLWGAPASQQ